MDDNKLRHELIAYLQKNHTHAQFEEAIKDFPEELMNKKVEELPYTAWQLLEHIRITQWDMVDFSRNPNYKEMEWPKDYWPADPGTKPAWDKSMESANHDLEAFIKIVEDPKTDLFASIPWGTGQTVFKEALQIIDHSSYHLGEIVMLRRLLGIWK